MGTIDTVKLRQEVSDICNERYLWQLKRADYSDMNI